MQKRKSQGRLLRIGLAAVLTCGLMLPTGAFAANEDDLPLNPASGDVFGDQLVDQAEPGKDAMPTYQETGRIALSASPRSANPFTVTGGTEGTDENSGDWYYDAAAGTLHIRTSTPLTISTAAQTSSNIEIDPGVAADLTLAGVDIATPADGTTSPINMVTNVFGTVDGTRATHADQIIRKTSLYLTLADGTSNTLSCLNKALRGAGSPGIRCGWGSVLVIDDSVRNLDSEGNIVEPVNGMVGSTVTLSNGTVIEAGSSLDEMDSPNPGTLTVNGGGNSAGIGSGAEENAGTLIFNGGNIIANACDTNSNNDISQGSGAAIGGGNGGSGTLTIFNGGHVIAQASYHGAAIGCGWGWWSGAGYYGPKEDAIEIPSFSSVPAYGTYNGYSFYNTGNSRFDTVAGDVYINGGLVEARGGEHGNGFGSGCRGTYSSNRNHVVRVTGGTLLPSSTSGNYDMGGNMGYVVITGGSVYTSEGKFQGLGNTAYNTQGISNWDDVVALPGQQLPDADKVFMITINLASEIETRNDKAGITDSNLDETITEWSLSVGGQAYPYGAPAQFHEGKLFLWLPKTATEQEITVNLTYKDKNGDPQEIEPLFRDPNNAGLGGTTLKRYISFELPDDFKDMSKYYDGTPLPGLSIDDENSIKASDGKDLSDAGSISYKYQLYTADKSEPLGAETASAEEMPSNVGVMKLTVDSTQFSNTDGFKENYWGHRATGWCEIKPIGSRVSLIEAKWEDGKDASVEDNARKKITITADIRRAEKDPDGNLTKDTCKAPRGYVQLFIDGQPVGDKIKLVFADDIASGAAAIADGDDATPEVNATEVPDGAGSYTRFTHTFVPADQDFLVPIATDNKKHEVSLQYIQPNQDDAAPANYLNSVNPADDPDAAPRAELAIEPVNPHPTVSSEPDPDNTDPSFPEPEVSTKPETDPDTVGPKEFEGTITTTYGKPTETLKHPGRVTMKVKTPSSGEISVTAEDGSLYKADFVRDEDGNPVRNDDGTYTLVLDPTAVGKGTLTFTQKPNGAYTGSTWTYDVIVNPSPQIAPKPKLTKTVENLTNPDGPTRPGDRLLYTITAENTAAGSAWTQVVITDPIPASMALVEDTLALDNPKDGRDGVKLVRADSVTAGDVGSFSLAEDADGKTVLTVPAGCVYGGAAATLTFECIVNEDVDFLTASSDELSLANKANAQGKRLNPDDPDDEDVDLTPDPGAKPGEGPTPTTPPVTPPGPGTIVPFDPATDKNGDIDFSKSVENLTDPDRTVTKVGDTLRYTITLANRGDSRSVLWDAAINDPLPKGIELKAGTMTLALNDGEPEAVDDSAYNAETRTVAVNVGDLWGGQSATLTFECTVTKDAFGQNNANIAAYHGTTPTEDPDHDPKGGDSEPGTPAPDTEDDPKGSTPPASIPEVLPGDPEEGDITVEKQAENLSGAQETKVGDTIRYTITLANSSEANGWMDAAIRDDVPRGLEIVSKSIKLVLPDGTALAVDDKAYDDKTRRLCVAAGRLFPGQTITLFFDALVTEEAIGTDIGNIAVALGEKPSQWEADEEHPTPGSPFDPEDDLAVDWPSYESAVEKVESPKAYPAGTDENNSPSKKPTGSETPGGSDDGSSSNGSDVKELPKTIAKDRAEATEAAKTGDMMGIALALGLALAAGAAAAMVLARTRLRHAPKHRR